MIPWDKIPEEYEYCAIDGGGCYEGVAWLFKNRPTPDGQGAWASEGVLSSLRNFLDRKEVAGYLATHPQDSLIYRYDYEESTVMDSEHSERSDRDSIREDIRKRLVKIKGIGPEKAERGSDAVMEYLDGLVSSQQDGPKGKYVPGLADEDGIECVKRPGWLPPNCNYIYWDVEEGLCWANTKKPKGKPDGPVDKHWSSGGAGTEIAAYFAKDYVDHWQVSPQDAIRRLVD